MVLAIWHPGQSAPRGAQVINIMLLLFNSFYPRSLLDVGRNP